ncbi:hypothetical protein HYQ61_1775 [Lactobacillus crispatus]|nr:hypothetical protein [Lactobacillus crispatus]
MKKYFFEKKLLSFLFNGGLVVIGIALPVFKHMI